MSPFDIAVAAERAEARAWADWYDAAPAEVRAGGGQRVVSVAGATLLMAPGIAAGLFNRVIGLGLHRPASADDLRAVVSAYREARVGTWVLQWNELAAPADLPELAQGMRFGVPSSRWAKMWRGREPVAAVDSALRVDEVDSAQAADAWAAAVAEGNGMAALAPWLRALHGRPGWRLYLLRDGDQPAGGGAMFSDGAQAWLGMGAVLPAQRRRHGQRLVMARRVQEAIAGGAEWIFTETGEPHQPGEANPSLENMKHCGFTRIASRINLPGPPAEPGAA